MPAPTSSHFPSSFDSAQSSSISDRTGGTMVTRDTELIKLKREIELLTFSENALKQECKEWQNKYRLEKDEVFRLSGASAKHNRKIKSLDDGITSLREQLKVANAKVAGLEAQAKKVAEWQIEQKQVYEEAIAQVRATLSAKDEKIKKLKTDLSEANRQIRNAERQTKEASSETFHNPEKKSDEKSRSTKDDVDALRLQILDLQHENTRLQNTHKDSRCEEFLQLSRKQLQDAKDGQAAAEAKIDELEQEIECLHAVLTETDKEADEAGTVELGLGVPPVQCDEPAPQPPSSTALALSDVQRTSTSSLAADKDFRLCLEDLGKCILNLTDIQLPSVEPETSSSPMIPNRLQNDSSRLNAPITININPSDRKNWRLFQHIQSAITLTSALDINGPPDLVRSLVTAMQRMEADHAEKTTLASQWQKIAAEHKAEADALREELERHPKCIVANHRYLADELQAKEIQWVMQEKMLAEWRRGAEGGH